MTTALHLLTAEAQSLGQRLAAAAEDVHGASGLSAAERAVLSAIQQGPQSVPQMARARSVSRQTVQVLVDALREAGLVQPTPNPASKRSPLFSLTNAGEKAVKEMARREARAFGNLTVRGLSDAELRHAAEVLREVRQYFESPAWEKRLKAVGR